MYICRYVHMYMYICTYINDVSRPWLSPLRGWGSLTMTFLVKLDIYSSPFHLATAQSQCLMVIGKDGSLSTLCHSCGFAVSRGC